MTLCFIIRNIYFISIPISGTETLKLWNFLSEDSSYKGIFCYVNKVTFRKPSILEWRLVVKETNQVVRGMELSVPPLPLYLPHTLTSGEGRGAKGTKVQSPMANDVINNVYVIKLP